MCCGNHEKSTSGKIIVRPTIPEWLARKYIADIRAYDQRQLSLRDSHQNVVGRELNSNEPGPIGDRKNRRRNQTAAGMHVGVQ